MFRKPAQSSLASLPWLATMLVPLSGAHAAGNTATGSGAANAEIAVPLVATHDAGAALNFGTFITASAGGSIIIDSLGGQTTSGAMKTIPGGTPGQDSFTLSGGTAYGYYINFSGGTLSNGGANPRTIAFNVVAYDPNATGTVYTLGLNGKTKILVQGTLLTTGNEPPGIYTGSYSITVLYL